MAVGLTLAAIAGGKFLLDKAGINPFDTKQAENALAAQSQAQSMTATAMRNVLSQQERPQMSAQVNTLSQLYNDVTNTLPEQQFQQQVELADRAAMTGVRQLQQGRTGNRFVGGLTSNLADAYRQANLDRMQMQTQNRLATAPMLAQAQGQQEFYNVLRPREQQEAEYMAMLGAGQQNQLQSAYMQSMRGARNQQTALNTAALGVDIASLGASGAAGGGAAGGGAVS